MKSIAITLVCSFLLAVPLLAQEKKQSPAKSTELALGELTVKINYSSPSVKGRTVYGELEPWGKIWRAGANEATTMEFSQDVKVNGNDLAAGKYAFFVIPMESGNWTLIFNKVHEQWGAYKYDESQDALRVNVEPSEIDHVEALTYSISDMGEVNLDWSTTRVGFKLK